MSVDSDHPFQRVVLADCRGSGNDDDNGVIWGNWSGRYGDGTAPSKWTSSSAILGEYVRNGGETPVKWGQCFAFAGCLTSVLRCLGVMIKNRK